MGLQKKLTKQGVRDLNHLNPKRPAAIEAEPVLAEEAHVTSPVVVVPESIAAPHAPV